MPSAAHAFNDEGVRRCVHAGVRSVEHAALAAPDTPALMAGRDSWLVPTHMVTVNHLAHLDDDAFWTGRPAHVRDKVRQHEDQLRRSVSTPIADDIRIAFGSDSGVFSHEENWHEFTAMVSTGMTPLRALRAATVEAAALLALSDRGAVRPGMVADLVAMPGDPFDDVAATGEVDFVMQHGTVVSGPGYSLRLADWRVCSVAAVTLATVPRSRSSAGGTAPDRVVCDQDCGGRSETGTSTWRARRNSPSDLPSWSSNSPEELLGAR